MNDIIFEVSGGSKGQPVDRALLISSQLLSVFYEDTICASFCKLLRVKQDVLLPELFFLHLLEIYDDNRIEKYQVQSTGITNFKFDYFLENEKLGTADQTNQSKFREAVAPVLEMIQLLGAKNAKLRRTRDLLLPKLISGEIDVDSTTIYGNGEMYESTRDSIATLS